MPNKNMPEVKALLRSEIIEMPSAIREATGIRVLGKRLKSFVFSTDVAVIRNCNADAVIAVYPFTPQPVITASLVLASDAPVFCGVGGGHTNGKKVINLALDAEFKGAMGIVLNSPVSNEILSQVKETIDIPIIVTIVSEYDDFESRIKAGASIFNVSGAKRTSHIVRSIREKYPDFPIIATGGSTDESIRATIIAGANAITYTPAYSADIFSLKMKKYREKYEAEERETAEKETMKDKNI